MQLSTEDFARAAAVKAETIRRGLCVNGHYLGVRPAKQPNGRLAWPAAEVEAAVGARKKRSAG